MENLHAGAGLKTFKFTPKQFKSNFEDPSPLSPQILLCFKEGGKPEAELALANLEEEE